MPQVLVALWAGIVRGDGLRTEGSTRSTPPTVVIVSNRVSALRHADNIIVLEDGRVVDQGTHSDLRARPGFYQDICGVQDA